MKIGEARSIYSAKLHEYQKQKSSLSNQKRELEKRMNASPDGKDKYASEAATLELSYNAVSEKYNEYQNFMEQLMDLHCGLFNAEAARQQGEAMAEYTEDLIKIMEVARRISEGAKVPGSDEKKLMEYSMEMYMAAKNMAMLKEMQERKEYDSLWDDDEEDTVNPDPNEAANDSLVPVSMDAPDLVSAADVAASAGAGMV